MRRIVLIAGCGLRRRSLALFTGLLFSVATLAARGQTFQITGVAYSPTVGAPSTTLPAGVNGAQLTLTGTLPSAAQQAASALLACFYTGYGSTAGIPLALPNGPTTEPLVVPASTIQAIPQGNFTAANNYTVTAEVYFIAGGQTCNGTFNNTLTNQYAMPIVAPSLGAYSGPTSVPQTNSATGIQAAPTRLTLSASGELYNGASGGTTSVTFGTFGSVPLTVATPSLYVTVPAAFSSSPVGTTASFSICNTFGSYSICTTPTPAITLTVAALASSTGSILATPTPVLTSGQTTLTAQFAQTPGVAASASAGAPSGTVTFAATGTTIPAAKLLLDNTAVFTAQTTTVTPPTTATPVISPKGGSYATVQTVSMTDATAGASIYYTQDGSTPTTASTLYTGPFTISTTQTIQAIAAAPGSLNSAMASSAYTITLAIVVSNATTGVNLQTPFAISLPAAPAGPITVTVSVPPAPSGPNPATISNSQTVAGGATLTFTNVTSANVGTIYVQGQAVGSETLTVAAPGYTSGTGTLSVFQSGFVYNSAAGISTTATSGPTPEAVSTAVLTPNLTIQTLGLALNPGVGPVTVSLTDSNTLVGTVSPTSLVFNTGDSTHQYNFQPLATGTANVTLGTPGGFSTAIQNQQITATVQ